MSDEETPRGDGQTRILIVPDDLLSWEVRESFLDRSSFVVRTALTADEALAITEVWRPTLVFFRSKLENTSVSRFCVELRKSCKDTRTKLLMLTDRVGEPLDDALEAASDAHLISPVETEQLYETIASLMQVPVRRSRRVPLEVLVQTEGFVDDQRAVDTALSNSINVSEDGMLLESNCHLAANGTGTLRFFLPDSSERLVVPAVVRVVVDEIRLHYAVEFVDLAPQYRAQIRQYVAESGEP